MKALILALSLLSSPAQGALPPAGQEKLPSLYASNSYQCYCVGAFEQDGLSRRLALDLASAEREQLNACRAILQRAYSASLSPQALEGLAQGMTYCKEI